MLKRSMIQLALMLMVIFLVVLIFKFIEPVKVAALVAGILFLLIGVGICYSEKKWGRGFRSPAFWTAMVFLLVFVLPIFGLRLLNWHSDFADLSVAGIKAQSLHELSSRCYTLLMATIVYEGLRPLVISRFMTQKATSKK